MLLLMNAIVNVRVLAAYVQSVVPVGAVGYGRAGVFSTNARAGD
jgi:hypothetical protein